MNDADSPTTKALPKFLRACAILAISMALVGGVCAVFGYSQSGNWGLVSAFAAMLVCCLAGFIGLLLSYKLQGDFAIHGVLGGMLARVGLPLATGIILQHLGGPLADAGVFGMIMACYLVMLLVETMLSVWLVRQPNPSTARSV